jgi:N-acetylglucosamine kinase-like BadF-type ATPase
MRKKNQKIIKGYVIGIDGGGTKTEVALADLSVRILKIAKAESASPRNVGIKKAVENIVEAIKKVKGVKKIDSIFIGLPAVEEEYKSKKEIIKKEILKRLKDFKGKLMIGSDQLVAFRSGTDKKDGIVLISGTGCVCHGWQEKKEAKTSGWGWLADEGSGFWTGQKGFQAVLKELDSRGSKTLITKILFKEWKIKNKNDLLNKVYLNFSIRQISLISKLVDKAADKRDKIAKDIMIEAGKELAQSAITVIKKLNFQNEKFSIVLVGGMFDSKTVSYFFKREVKKIAKKTQFLRSKVEPVIGAVKLAIEQLTINKEQ